MREFKTSVRDGDRIPMEYFTPEGFPIWSKVFAWVFPTLTPEEAQTAAKIGAEMNVSSSVESLRFIVEHMLPAPTPAP